MVVGDSNSEKGDSGDNPQRKQGLQQHDEGSKRHEVEQAGQRIVVGPAQPTACTLEVVIVNSNMRQHDERVDQSKSVEHGLCFIGSQSTTEAVS